MYGEAPLVNLRSIDLNLLVTFEAVVAERSVSAAAERLGLTQSAVSHALRRLRTTFGDQLLVRTSDGMEPTPRALQIAAVVSEVLGQISQVIDEQKGFDPQVSERSFTLRVSEYVAPFLLPTLCSRLRREAPRLTLRVAHFDPREADGRIGPDEIHVRTASLAPPAAASVGQRLLEDEFIVLMSRSHPQAGRPMTLERYLELPHMKVAAAALGTNMIDERGAHGAELVRDARRHRGYGPGRGDAPALGRGSGVLGRVRLAAPAARRGGLRRRPALAGPGRPRSRAPLAPGAHRAGDGSRRDRVTRHGTEVTSSTSSGPYAVVTCSGGM
jgi:DNA-binding transcriptional LysR family regulator